MKSYLIPLTHICCLFFLYASSPQGARSQAAVVEGEVPASALYLVENRFYQGHPELEERPFLINGKQYYRRSGYELDYDSSYKVHAGVAFEYSRVNYDPAGKLAVISAARPLGTTIIMPDGTTRTSPPTSETLTSYRLGDDSIEIKTLVVGGEVLENPNISVLEEGPEYLRKLVPDLWVRVLEEEFIAEHPGRVKGIGRNEHGELTFLNFRLRGNTHLWVEAEGWHTNGSRRFPGFLTVAKWRDFKKDAHPTEVIKFRLVAEDSTARSLFTPFF